MIDLGFPQNCSLAVLSQLSERATFISIKMHGYNTEIENIPQKDSTYGRRNLVGVTSRSISGKIQIPPPKSIGKYIHSQLPDERIAFTQILNILIGKTNAIVTHLQI